MRQQKGSRRRRNNRQRRQNARRGRRNNRQRQQNRKKRSWRFRLVHGGKSNWLDAFLRGINDYFRPVHGAVLIIGVLVLGVIELVKLIRLALQDFSE